MTRDERSTVPATVIDRLFVYGTLRTGQRSRDVLTPFVRRSMPAVARGTLYALPAGYPGVIPDDAGAIIGELVELSELSAALPELDAFEGDEFLRILTEVATDDGPLWAWIYVLTSPELARTGARVEHGDWVRYLTDAGR